MGPAAAAALDAFRRELAREGQQLLVVHLVYAGGITELMTLPVAPVPPDRPASRHRTRPPVEQAILDVLAEARGEPPLLGSAIAARAHRNYTSYFREVLSRLVASGEIVRNRETGGYVLGTVRD